METLDVKIMGRDFRIACKPGERSALLRAVNIVETKMSGIRDNGRVIGVDKIAVMAALQIAHESLTTTNPSAPVLELDIESVERKIDHISKLAEQGLKS